MGLPATILLHMQVSSMPLIGINGVDSCDYHLSFDRLVSSLVGKK